MLIASRFSNCSSIRCGVGDPAYEKILDIPPTIVPQQYLNDVEIVKSYRRLQNQQYDDNGAFIPIEDVHEAGGTAPIRIKAVWDVIHNGDPTNAGFTPASRYQCVTASKYSSFVVNPTDFLSPALSFRFHCRPK